MRFMFLQKGLLGVGVALLLSSCVSREPVSNEVPVEATLEQLHYTIWGNYMKF